MIEFSHKPVLAAECLELLNIRPGGVIIDGTLGLGGHSELILNALGTTGKLIGIDKDPVAIEAAKERLGARLTTVHDTFFNMKEIASDNAPDGVDGILLDLGVSSYQLDDPTRGFSYQNDGPLDMRMNPDEKFTAWNVVNGYSERELSSVIFNYGEERWAKRIAQFIVKARAKKKIETTFELVEIIKAAIPAAARREGPHPAKRTFQAIRIEVNGELKELGNAIRDCAEVLGIDGVLCIITFHSLEDRIVKQTFAELARRCTCPPEAPICTCDRKERMRIITKHPIVPSEEELNDNPRSRSAKVRSIRRTAF